MTKNRLLLAGLLLAFFFNGSLWVVDNHIWIEEFHKRPSSRIFAEVLGVPMPPGVSQVKVAARQLLVKCWIKMRFNATPRALQLITQGKSLAPTFRRSQALGSNVGIANSRFNSIDFSSIGWANVTLIKKPEIYQLNHYSAENFNWAGFIIVDRAKGKVFVQAGGD